MPVAYIVQSPVYLLFANIIFALWALQCYILMIQQIMGQSTNFSSQSAKFGIRPASAKERLVVTLISAKLLLSDSKIVSGHAPVVPAMLPLFNDSGKKNNKRRKEKQ